MSKAPPPLPPALADPTPIVLAGTGVWLAAVVVLLGATVIGDRPLDEWFWATVCGLALGLLGYALFRWQRAAARRGSPTAQQGLTP